MRHFLFTDHICSRKHDLIGYIKNFFVYLLKKRWQHMLPLGINDVKSSKITHIVKNKTILFLIQFYTI